MHFHTSSFRWYGRSGHLHHSHWHFFDFYGNHVPGDSCATPRGVWYDYTLLWRLFSASLCDVPFCWYATSRLLQGWLSMVWCISSASPVDTSFWPSTHWLTCTLCPGAQGNPTSNSLVITGRRNDTFCCILEMYGIDVVRNPSDMQHTNGKGNIFVLVYAIDNNNSFNVCFFIV